ncbi:MAG: type II toxin-antitoxin system PemK/MazF family toxin [Gemmatimonadetes bacterium]|jgi:mRNA interferase MazF|nr:type II toxin-antitoxin system PemK/MazF family toxin [Gemmatimonadota bacterium]
MICEAFAVVDVPFPFSDLPRSKRRKALVLSDCSFNDRNGASILMMITSATGSAWHHDVALKEWAAAGLRKPCVARPKLFTLDNRLISTQIGELAASDRQAVARALQGSIPLLEDSAAA